MATFYSNVAGVTQLVPNSKVRAALRSGKIRYMEAQYIVPATGGPAIGDVIQWGRLPVGALVLAQQTSMSFAAGAASSTLNLGDAATPTRYFAATSVASASTASGTVPANGAQSFFTSQDLDGATNNTVVQSVVAGAALLAGQVISVRVAYVVE